MNAEAASRDIKILHLVVDDKFIDFVAELFGSVPGTCNRFIVVTDRPEGPLKYVRKLVPFRRVDWRYLNSEAMRADLENTDALVVHWMNDLAARVINCAPAHVVLAWSGWGGDYYGLLPGGEGALLGPETRRIERSLRGAAIPRRPRAFVGWLRNQVREVYAKHAHLMPALRRIQVFSAPIPDDYGLLKSALGVGLSASYHQINYDTLEDGFALGEVRPGTQMDILVGNSASFTNNHVEAFRLLARHDLSGRKVVVPLSYGDPRYRDAVLEHGTKLLGKHFDPVLEFMPLDEYNTRISTCGIVVMNHLRQQALGNLGSTLYRGAKIFLDERNVVTRFMRRRGAHVCTTQMLGRGETNALGPLTADQRADNRRVLHEFWGKETVYANALEFVAALEVLTPGRPREDARTEPTISRP